MEDLEKESLTQNKNSSSGTVVNIVVIIIAIVSGICGIVFFIAFVSVLSILIAQRTGPNAPLPSLKIGILTPGFQYDFYFAGLMKNAALRAKERLEQIFEKEVSATMVPKIEFVLCEGCTYDEADLVVQVSKLYNNGVKWFVGPLTSSQCETLANWALISAPDALFVSPSATSNILSTYGNVIRMIMSNFVRASAYASKFSEFRGETNVNETDCGKFSKTRVFSIWKDDISSNEFYSLMNKTSRSHLLELEPPVVYPKDLIESKADALTYISSLASQVVGSPVNSTVIFVQAHTEITYILEACDDFPILLDYNWFIIGMGFNQDLLLSHVSVKNAVRTKLSSLLYTGNGYTYLEDKLEFVENVYFDQNISSPATTVGILNPTIFHVHDAVLLIYDTVRMHGSSGGVTRDNMVIEALHEFGFAGHLKMNKDYFYRYSGQYSFVTVSNISSTAGWVVLSEIYASPIQTSNVGNRPVNVSVEYVINEKELGVVFVSNEAFDSYCEAESITFEGIDKYGNFKTASFEKGSTQIETVKSHGMAFSMKNDKNIMKVDCLEKDNVFEGVLESFKMWIVCPFSYSGNFPDCSFIFFDKNDVELKSYQYVLSTFSMREAIYDDDISEWVDHGLGYLMNNHVMSEYMVISKEVSKEAVDSVMCDFKNSLQQ